MKKSLVSIIFCLAVIAVNAQGIKFETEGFDKALLKAKTENKPLFIDMYAVWCGPCKWMSETIFPQKEVGDYFSQNFIAIKIDVEKGEGPIIKDRYRSEGLPSFLYLDGDGNVIYRFTGSAPTEKFLEHSATALRNFKDPNNISRFAAQYVQKKNDETFVKGYLDKLAKSGSQNHTDILEQYLSIQKSIPGNSVEMAKLLYDHNTSIVFGGKADEIFFANRDNESWESFVRKDVRDCFQKLPAEMANQTTQYAVEKRDTSLLSLSIKRAEEVGLQPKEGQLRRLQIYYYYQTGQGEQFKPLMRPDIEGLYQSLNVKELQEGHIKATAMQKKDTNLRMISHATKLSGQLLYVVSQYAQFVTDNKQEQDDVLRWTRRIYEILPTDLDNANFTANVEYMYGDRELGMKIKSQAIQMAAESKSHDLGNIKTDYEKMKANKPIIIK